MMYNLCDKDFFFMVEYLKFKKIIKDKNFKGDLTINYETIIDDLKIEIHFMYEEGIKRYDKITCNGSKKDIRFIKNILNNASLT